MGLGVRQASRPAAAACIFFIDYIDYWLVSSSFQNYCCSLAEHQTLKSECQREWVGVFQKQFSRMSVPLIAFERVYFTFLALALFNCPPRLCYWDLYLYKWNISSIALSSFSADMLFQLMPILGIRPWPITTFKVLLLMKKFNSNDWSMSDLTELSPLI